MMNLNNVKANKANMDNNVIKAMSEDLYKSVIENQVKDTYDVIKHLKSNKSIEIDLSNKSDVIRNLARLGYVSGSLIGVITNLIETSNVLMNNEFNKCFLKKDGTVSMFLLRKVFPTVGTKPSQSGYESIYTEENGNIIPVETLDGRKSRLLKIIKEDINTFVNKIETASKLTQEDLVKIGKDLEQIGRLMQELEIDSAKDITVKDGMREITTFMDIAVCKLASKKAKSEHNFKQIVADYENNRHADKFKMNVQEYISVDKVFEESKKDFELFLKNNPHATEEEMTNSKNDILKCNLRESYIEDPAMSLKFHMIKNQEAYISELVEYYKMSNMNLFNDFRVVDDSFDEDAVSKLQMVTVTALDMITFNYAYRKYVHMNKVEDIAKELRNVIYTEGVKLGFTPKDVFRVAMSAGFLRKDMKDNKKLISVSSDFKFRYAAISAMFENELKWYFNPEVMYESIDVELPDGFELNLETPIEIVNGECEVEIEDGYTDYIICPNEPDFNGKIMAILENDEVVFIKDTNEFNYEEVDYVLLDEICNMNSVENSYIHEEANANPHIGLLAATPFSASEKIPSIISEVFDAFNRKIRVPRASEEIIKTKAFRYGAIRINSNQYLTVTNGNQSRVAGRLLCNKRVMGLSEYDKFDTIVTDKGALIILRQNKEQN